MVFLIYYCYFLHLLFLFFTFVTFRCLNYKNQNWYCYRSLYKLFPDAKNTVESCRRLMILDVGECILYKLQDF